MHALYETDTYVLHVVYARMCVHVYWCACMQGGLCMHVCACVHVCMYACKRVCMFMHDRYGVSARERLPVYMPMLIVM
jgi:hypothetical protein